MKRSNLKNIAFALICTFSASQLMAASTLPLNINAMASKMRDATVRTKTKASHLWFCFRNPSQCTQKENEQARAWFIGTPAAILAALLAGIGIVVGARKLKEMQYHNLTEQLKEAINSGDTIKRKELENLLADDRFESLRNRVGGKVKIGN